MRPFLLALTLTPAALASAQAGPDIGPRAHEAVFDRFKESIVTVEVVPLAGEAKSVLGSGYVVGEGQIITNYHVVGSYIEHPDRYEVQVKNARTKSSAKIVAFDLIHDLALLDASLHAAPLGLAAEVGRPGAPVIAFGNPQGLGLSLIEGIFNGFAEKGFVERMLLSMPLNSGMSGGPILNARNEVVGTNVSVSWRANSLSFGVPVTAVRDLLKAARVTTSEDAFSAEVNRQLGAAEASLFTRAVRPLTEGEPRLMAVAGAQVPRLPEAFECWNQTERQAHEEIRKTSLQCNLQFTPSLEQVGEVASLEVLVEHFTSARSVFGFYGGLTTHAPQHFGAQARAPGNGVLSPPECRVDRIRTEHLTWKVNTCSYAYVRYPDTGYFAMTATSVSRPKEAVYLTVHGRGVGAGTFTALTGALLRETRLVSQP